MQPSSPYSASKAAAIELFDTSQWSSVYSDTDFTGLIHDLAFGRGNSLVAAIEDFKVWRPGARWDKFGARSGPADGSQQSSKYFVRTYLCGVTSCELLNQLDLKRRDVVRIYPQAGAESLFVGGESLLGASSLVIGAIPAVMTLGWWLPSLFTAGHTQALARKLPFVLRWTVWERVPVAALAAVAFLVAERAPDAALAMLLVMLLVLTGVGGALMPAWMDIVGRAVPLTLRGRFFALSSVAASVAGLAGSLLTAHILATIPAPALPEESTGNVMSWFVASSVTTSSLPLLLNVMSREPQAGPSGGGQEADGGAGGFDSLVVNGTFDTMVFTPTGPHSGYVDRDGDVIEYAGLEPVNAGNATNVVFNGDGGASNIDTWILEDSPTAGNLQLRSTTGQIETTQFAATATTITLNLGAGNDSLTIASPGDSGFTGSIIVNGNADDDTLTVSDYTGNVTFAGGGGNNTIAATKNQNFTLTNSSLSAGDGLECQFIHAPFRFCLNCGIEYAGTQRSDFPKLASLGTEGRSTATTILTLAAIRQLQDQESLSPTARKLLSFTDNRQDAALQAGHFNDFVQVVRLRAGICKALMQAPSGNLTYATIGEAVFKALRLSFLDFADMKEEPKFADTRCWLLSALARVAELLEGFVEEPDR